MKKILSLILVVLFVFAFTGCSEKSITTDEFHYSNGLDENGYWQNIRALDHVELFDHENIVIPAAVHTVSAAELADEMSLLLSYYATKNHVTDRQVKDGDTLNIDYVGSVGGEEFAGGSTGGQGTEVTIGVTSYIDGFLEQLIGHTPGETFDIEVTFPENYGHEDLNGQEAVFRITINYIIETIAAELTDDFVKSTLGDIYGWQTAAEAETAIRQDMQQEKITKYIENLMVERTTIKSIPESLVEYQNQAILFHYQDYADYYEMEFAEFISEFVGVSSTEELLEKHAGENAETVRFYIILQAIAEATGMVVSEADVARFFAENMDTDDYSEYEEFYGLPYLKLITLHNEINEYLQANVILD